MTHLRLFLRGFVIVTLTAYNVTNIAQGQYGHAFLGGFGISFVWWGNSRGAAHTEVAWARETYALGAACGTVVGMYLAR